MVAISKSAELRFFLDGIEIDAPVEWSQIRVLATFDNEAIQANISTDQFTFVREGYEQILDYIASGLSGGVGIFEGVPFQIQAYNINQEFTIFDGYIDLTNELVIDEENLNIKVRIIKKEGLNSLEKRVEGVTFAVLETDGLISNASYTNIDYVVEKPIDPFEIIITNVVFYLLLRETFNQVRETAKDILNPSAISASGVTGPVGAAIYAAGVIIIELAYSVALLAAVLKLGQDLFNSFIQPKRTHKSLNLKTGLQSIASYLGLQLQTDIELLDNLFYLPSNQKVDTPTAAGFINKVGTIEKGIPNESDFGYELGEYLQLLKDLFYAKYAIKEGKLLFYAENSDFWRRTSTYQMPGLRPQPFSYNTDEFNASISIEFQYDSTDIWTLENSTGTFFASNASAKTVKNTDANFVSGRNKTSFPVALANRKDSLNAIENLLKTVGAVFDGISKLFGGNSNFSKRVKNRVGSLKVSDNNHFIPKIVYLEGDKIPVNHRSLFNSRILYENFHNYKSFVADNFERQRKQYQGVPIPFGFNDFLSLIENSYFRDINGDEGKVLKIEWLIYGIEANVDYWIPFTYTKNLQETFIE